MKFKEIVPAIPCVNVLDLGVRHSEGEQSGYELLDQFEMVGIDFGESESTSGHLHIKEAIGDGNNKTLYECQLKTCSSLYKPNIDLLQHYNQLAEWLQVTHTEEIQTKKLNDIELPFLPDYIKSDLQGSDLWAFQHGTRYTKEAIVIEVEVEFIEQYEDQPLFSDIHNTLRKQGFFFHTFTGYGSRLLKPMYNDFDPFCASNQWMWSHAVFVKNIFSDHSTLSIPPEQWLKLATIMHDIYQSYDLVAFCLKRFDALAGCSYADKYIKVTQSCIEN
ncbi:FkbM family methyltransferase [Vibrio profundum]|uniref:FkbM family methyltransferase n=1 Tax=Vibrio profundum TaxID=2910247 RepID=UPI003D0C8067